MNFENLQNIHKILVTFIFDLKMDLVDWESSYVELVPFLHT